jgi:hypothetical protein
MSRVVLRLAAMAVVLITLTAGRAVAGPITFHVHINTAADPTLPGTAGSLEFQFNPSTLPTPVITATVTNFNGDGGTLGIVSTVSPPVGDASGDLRTTGLFFDNQMAFNDLIQNFKYGNTIDFNVTFSQNLPQGSNGSTFSLILWDQPDGFGNQHLVAPGFANQPGNGGPGAAVIINNGGPTPGPAPANPAVTTSSAVTTPEPGTLALLGLGVGALLAWRRRTAA